MMNFETAKRLLLQLQLEPNDPRTMHETLLFLLEWVMEIEDGSIHGWVIDKKGVP